MTDKWKNLVISWKLVFGKPIYAFLTLGFILFLFFTSIFILSWPIVRLFGYQIFNLNTIFLILEFFKENSTFWSRSLLIIVSVLTGINLSMLFFYLKRRIKLEKSLGAGIIGTMLGILGIGCASCGYVLVSSIFGLGFVTGFLGLFPFNGAEVGLIGIIFIIVSIYLLSQKIPNPLSCKID